jgi:hypothetical protein
MFPNVKITISRNGDSLIEGLGQGDSCPKLSDLGTRAGRDKVDKMKDPLPVDHSMPCSKITIFANGEIVIEGLEQGCIRYKLSDLGSQTGKIKVNTKKDH